MKTLTHPTAPLASLRSLALVGAAAFALTGCMTGEDRAEDVSAGGENQGAFLVSELDQMGQTLGELSGDALAKLASDSFTITGELVIDPFAFREECGCFVRRAQYTGQRGYERTRLDSVTFLDSAGDPLDAFRPGQAPQILYRRAVERSLGAREMQVSIAVTVDMQVVDGAKVGVWNGTLSGVFEGQEFKSATIANVVRPFSGGRFRFPQSGTIELTRPLLHFLVEFQGDGKAKVTVKNRRTGRIRILWVDADYRETPAQE